MRLRTMTVTGLLMTGAAALAPAQAVEFITMDEAIASFTGTTPPAPALNADQGAKRQVSSCKPSDKDDPDTWRCEDPVCPVSNATYWVRNSAEYKALVYQTFQFAGMRAIQHGFEREAGTWVVVMDLDETVLSNSAYSYERERCGRGYSRVSWADWSKEEAATLLPGAERFIDLVYAQGGHVVGVTNRRQQEDKWTYPILDAAGIQYEGVLFRGDEDDATGEKEPRFDAVPALMAERGYENVEVVMYIGDQITDFPDQNQSDYKELDPFRGTFGIEYFVLPNPMYGSWEPDAEH